MKKNARFIGKDGSCGLKHGKVYRIDIVDNRNDSHEKFNYRVFTDNVGIPYDTMNAIRKNWDIFYE